jgi:hypothetical protein
VSQNLNEVRTQITNLVKQGWIRSSLGPWGAPVLFQGKKDGKARTSVVLRHYACALITDYLNHHTIKHAYPMPRIKQLLQKVGAYIVICKLDIKSGTKSEWPGQMHPRRPL